MNVLSLQNGDDLLLQDGCKFLLQLDVADVTDPSLFGGGGRGGYILPQRERPETQQDQDLLAISLLLAVYLDDD